MTFFKKFQSLRQSPRRILHQKTGFSLIELMVYIAIFAIFSIGVSALMLQIQTAFSTNKSFIEDTDDEAMAIRRLQVQLGKSDALIIDNVSAGDRACLKLQQDTSQRRSGYRFNGLNQSIEPSPSPFFIPSLTMPRTVSVWIQVPASQSGVNTIIKWGKNAAYEKYALALVDGRPRIDVGCASFAATSSPDLRDGKWHHIVTSHKENSLLGNPATKFYIDGQPVLGQFVASCGGSPKPPNTDLFNLQIGVDSTVENSHFLGKISDLIVFTGAILPTQVGTLYRKELTGIYSGGSISGLFMTARWMMNSTPAVGQAVQVVGGSANNLYLYLRGYRDVDPLMQTIEEGASGHSFCFLDDNNDGRYALWEANDTVQTPQRGGETGWIRRTREKFVPTGQGFFTTIGDDPVSVVGNFALVDDTASGAQASPKAQSKALTTRKKIRHLELCTIAPTITLDSARCNFKSAHIIIDDYSAQSSGQIELLYSTASTSNGVTTFRSIPNMPSTVIGQWHDDVGIFSLSTSDGSALPTILWKRALQTAIYRPRNSIYKQFETFTFGLGGAPKMLNGAPHFYDFVLSKGERQSIRGYLHTYNIAQTEAQTLDAGFCGMPSHLATLTSEAENQHLTRVTTAAHGDMQSGWLGAWIDDTDRSQSFKWRAGPDNGTTFWQGSGQSGSAIIDDANKAASRPVGPRILKKIGVDHLPQNRSNSYRRIIFAVDGSELRFTDFAFGYPTNNCNLSSRNCQPSMMGSGKIFLTIQGDPASGGLWYSYPENGFPGLTIKPYCLTNALGTKICGHYRELSGTPTLDPTAIMAEPVKVNMERFAEFCKKL